MRAVDTNVVVRLVARDDARQVAAAERFMQSGAWVSHVVLLEAIWTLKSIYGFSPSEIVTAVEMLLHQQQLSIQDAETVAAAVRQFRVKPRLGFSDCLILEIARKAGHLPLGTFDHDLGGLDGTHQL